MAPPMPSAAELTERLQRLGPRPWLTVPNEAELQPLARGAYHLNFLLENRGVQSVLRLCRNSQWGLTRHEQLSKEFATLQDVACSGVAPRPRELVTGEVPILIESFVAGTPFEYTSEGLYAAGRSVGHVHTQRVFAGLGRLPTVPGYRFLLDDGAAWLSKAEQVGHAPETTACLRAHGAELNQPTVRGRMCIVHTDLTASNLLATHDGVAILDWEGARLGDSAWDLAYFLSPVTTRWGPGRRALSVQERMRFLAGYSSITGENVNVLEEAVVQWMPLVIFRALAWCVGFEAITDLEPGPRADLGRFTNPQFVEQVWAEALRT